MTEADATSGHRWLLWMRREQAARGEAKGEEKEDDADINALHLRRRRSATMSAPLDICIGADANVERCRPSPHRCRF